MRSSLSSTMRGLGLTSAWLSSRGSTREEGVSVTMVKGTRSSSASDSSKEGNDSTSNTDSWGASLIKALKRPYEGRRRLPPQRRHNLRSTRPRVARTEGAIHSAQMSVKTRGSGTGQDRKPPAPFLEVSPVVFALETRQK